MDFKKDVSIAEADCFQIELIETNIIGNQTLHLDRKYFKHYESPRTGLTAVLRKLASVSIEFSAHDWKSTTLVHHHPCP